MSFKYPPKNHVEKQQCYVLSGGENKSCKHRLYKTEKELEQLKNM